MVNRSVVYFIFSIFFLAAVAEQKGKCKKCMPAEKCPLYGNMSKQVQTTWNERFPCNDQQDDVYGGGGGGGGGALFGFAQMAKGDNICCPEDNIWGIEDADKSSIHQDYTENERLKDQKNSGQTTNLDNDQNLSHENQFIYSEIDSNESDKYEQSRIPSRRRYEPQFNRDPKRPQKVVNRPLNGNNFNGNYENNPNAYGNSPYFNGNNPNFNRNYNGQGNYPNSNLNNPNFNVNNAHNNVNNPNFNVNNPHNNVNNPNLNVANQNFNVNNPNYNRNNPYNGYYPNVNGGNGNTRNQGKITNGNIGQMGGQCSALTSFAPDPQTGCCGRDESISDRIAGQQNNRWGSPNRNQWNAPANSWSNTRRYVRETADNIDITFDNRIAGGKETEFEQFPWTVLLKATFDYGNKKASFNCGGALISSRYVLTAAHCVSEEGARLSDVEINLAEYDKRTFPQDCRNVLGEGRKCIENMVMKAEDIVAHPNFDDRRLQNDIALIRLRGSAPYTDYIRPICLPPINIDNPDYSNLRLAVAGWGRNGSLVSQVKQSTVVNLVPQQDCVKNYPQLTRRHLCAAGRSGEDTCKGDSGGPLMMLYEGKYFVSGLVSGKRADSPCGTSVPSLYTNVYQYLDWIKSNIRN